MAELNEAHLSHEGVTDVITFSYLEDEGDLTIPEQDRVVGEIFVCPDVAFKAAAEFTHSISEEVVLYFIHGILHMCGLDDRCVEDAAEMRLAEQRLMGSLREEFDLTDLIRDTGDSGCSDKNKTEV